MGPIKNFFFGVASSPMVTRLKSFLWNALLIGAVATLNNISQNISGLGLSAVGVTIVGLIIAEITKAIQKNIVASATAKAAASK